MIMVKKSLSFFLIISLIASTIFAGAISRSFADSSDSYQPIYWGDIKDYVYSLNPSNDNNWNAKCNQFFTYTDQFIPTDYVGIDKLIYCLWDSDGSILIGVFQGNNNGDTGLYYNYTWLNYSGLTTNANSVDQPVRLNMVLYYNASNTSGYLVETGLPVSGTGFRCTTAFDFSSPNYVNSVPSFYNFQVSGRKTYVSRDINKANTNFESYIGSNWEMEKNISDVPLIESYNLKVFNIGTLQYITSDNQLFMREMQIDLRGLIWQIIGLDTDYETIGRVYSFLDLVEIPYIQAYCDGLYNVPDHGRGYALPLPSEFTDIVSAQFIEYLTLEERYTYADAVNVPLDLEEDIPSHEDLVQQTYIDAHTEYNNYLNSYNQNHVVPQQLSTILFGNNGTKTYPVEVLAPNSFYDSGHFGEGYWQWHLPLMSDSAMNWEYLDVLIMESSGLLQDIMGLTYRVWWYYEDSLSPSQTIIDTMEFPSLIDLFDVIIILSDIPNSDSTNVYTGNSDMGLVYSDTTLGSGSDILHGFAFVTKRAIQKQQLYNFNEGITKTYQLMCDYINNRDSWDDSFLLWSASVFDMLDTINGRLLKLDEIYKLLFDLDLNSYFQNVLDKLNQLVDNTDEQVHNFWILPVYDFVSDFVPDTSGFVNWIDAIEDFGEDMPLIPVVTMPPLPTFAPYPTIGG